MDDLQGVSKETAWQLGYAKGRSDAVRHGRWVKWIDEDECWGDTEYPQCSQCGAVEFLATPWCPKCGAKMELERGNEHDV